MLLLRKFSLLLCILTLGACGMTPVYQKDTAVREELAAITLDVPENSREHLQLKARLEDVLSPSGQQHARYRLAPNLSIIIEQLSIDGDGITRRYRILGKVTPTLTDVDTGEVVMNTTLQRFNSYHISDADYSTYVAAQDAKEQLVAALADEIRLQVIAHFQGQ